MSYDYKAEMRADEEREQKKRLEKKRRKRKMWMCLGSIPAFFVLIILVSGVWYVGGGYTYREEIGDHFDNADKMNTPEAIIAELELAKAGMHKLGLENDMYSRWFTWEQTPHHRMSYQYELVDTIIQRAWDVIEWKNITYEDNTTTDNLNDVYNEKVRSLRGMISDDTDSVARGAYMMNVHPIQILLRCIH